MTKENVIVGDCVWRALYLILLTKTSVSKEVPIGWRRTSARISVGMLEWARHHPVGITLLMHSQIHQSLC